MLRYSKIFLMVLFVILYLPSVAKANNNIVDVPNFATLEFPKQVKLSKSKCQNIPIDYEINENLDLNGAALLIQIGYIPQKKQAGFTVWFGKMQNSDLLAMPMIGQLKIKVCQNAWTLKDQKFIAVKPGNFDLYIAYGYYLEDGTTQKQVISRKIKFIK